jgi:hypothetical protein
MADSFELAEPETPSALPRSRKGLRRVGVSVLVLAVAGLGGLWLARNSIADRIIVGQLKSYGLPATYEIESIGPGSQILRNVVVGDPRRPDLTIERVEVGIRYGFGAPYLGSVKLVAPRIYGQVRDGRVSFGSLDKVIYAPKTDNQPFTLPKLDLQVLDGRGLILTDSGKVGLSLQGSGGLQNGFAGTLVAVAPSLAGGGCSATGARFVGKIAVREERPSLTGPLRLDRIVCENGTGSGPLVAELEAQADKGIAGLSGSAMVRGNKLVAPGVSAETLALDTRLAFRDGALSGRVDANAGGVSSGGVRFGLLGLEGSVRTRDSFHKAEFRGTIDGQGLRQGDAFANLLASGERSSAGTLLAPMLSQLRTSLKREERGSRLSGEIALRRNGESLSVVIPQAHLVGGSGQALLTLSKFQLATATGTGPPLLAGNFVTGGTGIPRIVGRMERGRAGQALFRLTMAPWRAGGGSLAIPEMMIAQVGDGSLGFSGTTQVSGEIPGGSVQNLVLPVNGAYGARGELALWKRCVTARFDRLTLGQMAVDGNALQFCPPGGSAIVRNGARGLQVAAGTPSLDLTGKLGETQMAVRTGAVGFAWPGVFKASAVEVALGPPATATHLTVANLDARVGGELGGSYGGVGVKLAQVPLDVSNASGQWRYVDGKLVLSGAEFDLTDRLDPERFEKLHSTGATLMLADNRITANALLREAKTLSEVAAVTVRHDLSTGAGRANLSVNNLLFDKSFQPSQLTRLALGVVANVNGKVTGDGVIDWTARGVTSSGTFGTESLDLAAAFGPVKGLKGNLQFTDLLGMVTAPHQKLTVASINPGIEVTEGVIDVTLLPDQVLRLHDARWPFLGGTLVLEPTDLRLGLAEARRYTLTVVGIDAAKFIEKMELGNLAATGTFDGQFPLIFDANGGRIEEGTLVSRAPGGNVSYIGALTYENMGAMANFAFDALKSLDYKTMTIAMRGDLEGEIVTNVKFGGVKQGAGTKQNFVTRQVASLPIQFNVNIRAPFYQLITSFKAMYDPAFVKDPRTLGLVDAQGRPLYRSANGVRPGGVPVIVLPGNPEDIQPAESGKMP